MKNKIPKILTIAFFMAFLIVMPILFIFSPKESFSELENRSLSSFPEFSFEKLFSKKYTADIDTWVSDHFPLRTGWIELKTNAELIAGKQNINDIYIVDNMMLQKLSDPDYDAVDKSISAINSYASKHNMPVFVMLAPTATGIYSEKLPKYAPKFDQKAFIDYVYQGFTQDNIVTLDAYNALYPTRDEYIYYRTDHHWTSLGAYYAYASAIKSMGFNPVLLSQYDIEHASSDFIGTLYSKVIYNGVDKDTIDFYHNPDGAKVESLTVTSGGKDTTYDSIYFRDYLDKKDKYSAFTGINQPMITIKTNSTSGKKLLVIKDSYAHSFVPFLTQHYSEIVMVDMRYISTYLDKAIDVDSFDQTLILYNADGFATDKNIKNIR